MRIVVVDSDFNQPVLCGIFRVSDVANSISEIQNLRETWIKEESPECFADYLIKKGFVEDSPEPAEMCMVD